MAKKKKVKAVPRIPPRPAADDEIKQEPVESTKEAVKEPAPEIVEPAPEPEAPVERDVFWLVSSAAIIVLSAVLRFAMLALKPFHHDEGVNGFFLTTLFKDGVYKYQPDNYHGPTLYYISVAFAKVFGLETVPVRVSMAIFGVLMVVLVLYLKNYIGRVGTLVAALFVALSPGLVFISRYFIHEIFFVFLSLAIAMSVLFFIEKRRAGPGAVAWMAVLLFTSVSPFVLRIVKIIGGDNENVLTVSRIILFIAAAGLVYWLIQKFLEWDEGRPIYLLLGSASVALFFGTKETAFITLGTMAIACISVWVWNKVRETPMFQKSWTGILLAVHGVLLATALFKSDTLAEGWRFLNDSFFPANKPADAFPFYAIVLLMIGAGIAWVIFLLDHKVKNETDFAEPTALTWSNFRAKLGQSSDTIVVAAAVATAFVYVFVLFFSSFFTYAEGVSKAFEAYAIWTKTGNKDHTQNGFFGYVKWGMKIEAPIMVLSVLGGLIALMKGKHRFAMFTGFWALGMLLAYSIIPYKTPWLALSFLLPMCIAAGYGIGQMYNSGSERQRVAGAAVAAVGVLLLGYQTYQLNFVKYDDEDMPYVYAHTRRGMLDMVAEIDRYAAKSGKGPDTVVEIVSPDYWPLTWYLAKYKANFHGTLIDSNSAELIVAKKGDQDTAMIQKYGNHYKYVDVYPLRPGVNLVLLVRKDIADADAKDVNKVTEYKPIPGVTN